MTSIPEDEKLKMRTHFEADFERRRNTPRAWYASAEQLLSSARILMEHHRSAWAEISKQEGPGSVSSDSPLFILPSIYLLYALGIENLLKARWVNQQARSLDKIAWPRFFASTSNGHSLVKIAALTGLPLNDEETKLLQRLEILARSTARYPTDKKVDTHLPNFDVPGWGMTHAFGSDEIAKMEKFISTRLPDTYLPHAPSV